MSDKDETPETELSVTTAASQMAAGVTANYAAASDVMVEMKTVMDKVTARYSNCPTAHGHYLEYIEMAKWNADAAVKESRDTAHMTEFPTDPGLKPNQQAPADILIRRAGKTVREVQVKSSRNSAWLAGQMARPEYRGMQLVGPKEQTTPTKEQIRRMAASGEISPSAARDTEKNLRPAIEHGGVSSGGTSYKEAQRAAKRPELFSAEMNIKQVGKEFVVTATDAALAATILSGAISTVKHSVSVCEHKETAKEAVYYVAKDASLSGTKAGAVGGTGVLIRYAAERCLKDGPSRTRASVSTAIAAGMVETGVAILHYSRGEIEADELARQMGKVSFNTAYSIFAGTTVKVALSGTIAPAVVAAAGFYIAQFSYHSCVLALKEADLAECEALRLAAISIEALDEMDRLRGEFESMFSKELESRGTTFDELFKALNRSVADTDLHASIEALTCFTGSLGKTLKYERFADFDGVMRSDKPLVL